MSLLHTAIINKLSDTAILLINKNAKLNTVDADGNTPLHLAISYDMYDIAVQLIEKMLINETLTDAFNIKNMRGETVVHLAAMKYKNDCLVLLIRNNANLNDKNGDGDTPLHMIINRCTSINLRKDFINLLLANNVDVNIKNKKYRTPLELVIRQYCDLSTFDEKERLHILDIIKLLLENKATVNYQILNYVMEKKLSELTNLLLEYVDDVNKVNDFNEN